MLEARYKSLSEGSDDISKILVLRRGDNKILVDSSGQTAGSTFFPRISLEESESGQFRYMGYIYSFSAAYSHNGAPILFLLASPLPSLIEKLSGGQFDSAKGLGFALADAEGSLLSPLTGLTASSSARPMM